LRKLLDSPICKLFKEGLDGFEDGGNQARTFVADPTEDLLAQQRRLFENGFKDSKKLVRTLVADLDEGMWAQKRRVHGMKRFIQQLGAGEGN